MDRKNVLIVSALEQETNGQLEGYRVLHTGVGKVNAAIQLTKVLHKAHLYYLPPMPKLVINYGTAGSKNLPIGELVCCTKFVQRDMKVTQLGFYEGQTPFESPNSMIVLSTSKFNPLDKFYVCGTGDNFVENTKKESLFIQVFDMEAFALAKVCRHYNVPFISFKYITDNANEHSAKDWEENCSDGVQLFKDKILKKLLDFNKDLL